jgi:long-chain acyl-CoA synthetase
MLLSTVREILVNTERKYGPEDAVRYKKSKNEIESKSYTQLRQDSESFSCVLRDMGEQGNHIAVIGVTSYLWLVTYFGTVNGGSVIVPLDVNLPAEDVCDLIVRSDSTVLVYDEVRKDVAALAKERCPGLKIMLSMQQQEHSDQAYSFEKLLEEHRGSFDYMPKPDQLCTIMFTSGTTGKSKGVMLTHRNVAENATCLDMKIPERIVILSVLPIHHAYCLSMDILKGISLAAVICINDSLMRVAKNIKLFKPEMILMVPLMIETMAKKLEEASMLPAKLVKNQVFGKQFHTI